MLWRFREPSRCRHVRRECMRNAWLDFTPIISATACQQRNYVETYSRFCRSVQGHGPLHARRLRIEHVNSRVKRCRIVKDRIRLWKEGARDLVMDICCALHNFRVRLVPWQPIVESG